MSAYHGGAAPGEARRRRDREADPSWRDNELHALCADEAVTVERVEAGDGYAAMATERSRTTQGQLPLHLLCGNRAVTVAVVRAVAALNPAAAAEDCGATDLIPGWVPALHVLCANPAVTVELVEAVAALHPAAAARQSDEGWTPLHALCANPAITVDLARAVGALCPNAAARDLKWFARKFPLHILCQNAAVTPDLVRVVGELYPEAAAAAASRRYAGRGLHGTVLRDALPGLYLAEQGLDPGRRWACTEALLALHPAAAANAEVSPPLRDAPDLIQF